MRRGTRGPGVPSHIILENEDGLFRLSSNPSRHSGNLCWEASMKLPTFHVSPGCAVYRVTSVPPRDLAKLRRTAAAITRLAAHHPGMVGRDGRQ